MEGSKTVNLNYNPGTIYSEDSIKVGPINYFNVQNRSTYTSLSANELQQMVIYPNPNQSGIFYYRIDETLFSKGVTSFDVIGANGITIMSGTISESQGYIDMRGKVSKGIYYLRMFSDDFTRTKPIIVE